MEIYLPIAEMSVNILTILLLGGLTGIMSGLFGLGGGFLTTPFLIFLGIPPSVAVASTTNQIVAASFSGFLAHNKKLNVDFKMGFLLLIGGFVGSSIGITLFRYLKNIGQIDFVISILYVTLLGGIGLLMAFDSYKSLTGKRFALLNFSFTTWTDRFPWKMEFSRSKLIISAWMPIFIGVLSGMMVSIMGVGGGFFMIPAMIYVLGMPASVVVGTSLFQIMFVTAHVTFFQAIGTQTVDIVLVLLLILGSVVGVQFGTKIGERMRGETLRFLLAGMVLMIAIRLLYGLFITPESLFSITVSDL
jgi:uncharacterized membrane protein YfcA